MFNLIKKAKELCTKYLKTELFIIFTGIATIFGFIADFGDVTGKIKAAILYILSFFITIPADVTAVDVNKKDNTIVMEVVEFNYNDKNYYTGNYTVSGDMSVLIAYSKDAFTCHKVKKGTNLLETLLSDVAENAIDEAIKDTTNSAIGNYAKEYLQNNVVDELKKGKCYDDATVEVKNAKAKLYKSYK